MNPSKKNINGWILCPSKSFPGKFYYFNVANGETAWSLNECEKKSLKNPTIPKIDDPHCYPEPSSPPVGHTPPPTVTKPVQPNLYTQVIENDIYQKNHSNNTVDNTPPPAATKPVQPNLCRRNIENNIYNENHSNITYPKDISYDSYLSRNFSSNVTTFVIQPMHFDQNYSKPAPPIQIQLPMIIGSNYSHQNVPQAIMILMNPYAQNNQLAIGGPKLQEQMPVQMNMEPDRELFIQTGKSPLSQRFVNYEKPIVEFEENKLKKTYDMSTPNKPVVPIFPHDQSVINSPGTLKNQTNSFEKNQSTNLIHDPILNLPQRTSENSEVFAPSTSHTNNPKINERNISNVLFSAFNGNNSNKSILQTTNIDTDPFKKLVIEKSTVRHQNKVENPRSPIKNNLQTSSESKDVSHDKISKEKSTLDQSNKVEKTSNDAVSLKNLDASDLRRTLLAKKRKAMDSESNIEGKRIKTFKQDAAAVGTPKKTVTFNLIPESMSDIASSEHFSYNEDVHNEMECEEVTAIHELKHLASPSKRGDSWYLVVDTTVLVEELQFLDRFVKLDPKCHLLIPSRVMSDTAALSRAECRERHLVTLARHAIRRLATSQPHIIVQSSHMKDNLTSSTTTEAILNCCIEVMEQNVHVVLITNNEDLQGKAESLQIHCFNTEQIKDSTFRKPEINFDIKKVKISITNVPENESPKNTSKKRFDGTSESTNLNFEDKISNTNALDFPFSTNDVLKADKSERIYNTTKNLGNTSKLKEKIQLQKNVATNATEFKIPTTPKNGLNVPNPNETVSLYFQNKNSELKNGDKLTNSKKESQTVSFFFQNEQNKEEQRHPSILEKANNKLNKNDPRNRSIFENENNKNLSKQIQPKSSIFEIDGIEKIETFSHTSNPSDKQKHSILENKEHQIKKSIFDFDHLPNKDISMKSSMLELEKYKIKKVQSKTSSFEDEKCKNKKAKLKPSIFENEKCKNREGQSVPSIFEINATEQPVLPSEIKNEDLEEFVATFYSKNSIEDERIEQKKEEIICSLVQTMEECLSYVLKLSSSIHKTIPPWTLQEALQCMVQVYGEHSTILSAVNILSVLSAQEDIKTKVLVKIVVCGLVLVRYLKDLMPNLQVLEDAEASLNVVLKNIGEQNTDSDKQLYRTPVTCADLVCEKLEHKHRRNFVKNRSEVVKYLKNHFTSWADYDETLEDIKSKSSWGQKYTDIKVVRTCGKNLGMLKINKSRTITMNEPTNNIEENHTKEPNGKESKNQENVKQIIQNGDDNNNETAVKISENIDAKEMSTMPKNVDENTRKINESHTNLKLVRVVENKPKNLVPNNDNIQRNKIEETNQESTSKNTNQKNDVKQIQPKVIRLFNNIKLTKDDDKSAKIDKDNSICNIDYSHGHTFGTDDKNGPKVVRNIKLIKEFEEKYKFQRKPLDLDRLDYSDISDREDNHSNFENDCLSINIDDSNTKDLLVDNLDATNDKEISNYDKQNNLSTANENNSGATNNDSYSMSLDNCVPNDIYATNDFKNTQSDRVKLLENSATNDNSSINDNHFGSDYVSCLTNIASYRTNDYCANENYHGRNYVSFETKYDSYAANDEYTKATHKDDTTNDSGYENESLQAYSIVKSFLNELYESFTLVHKFIERSVHDLRNGTLQDSKRRVLHSKANATHAQIAKIITKLRSIILREVSNGTTLKVLMAGADDLATKDGHIYRYRHVVTQCLKQARILDRALRLMLSLTDGSTTVHL